MVAQNYTLILASQSPRRKELLQRLGFQFSIRVKDVEESFDEQLNDYAIAEFLAQKKAAAYRNELNANELLITADTIVSCNGSILNKPQDHSEAKAMLLQLSGNQHKVITGVSLTSTAKQVVFHEVTKVQFDQLEEEEMDRYIESGAPMDKAGAYGIQDWIGTIGVTHIEGSFENVVGLPTQRLYRELKHF